MRPLALLLALAASAASASATADDDWSACPPPCRCKWFSGRKTAECSNGSLTAVPQGLSAEIQTLDLTGNAIGTLRAGAFRSARLVNLHKLFVRDCGVAQLHRDAFAGLEILIELDLSRNRIAELLPGTFRDNVRLRLVSASHNPIQTLSDRVFEDLPHLQTVELSHCHLSRIAQRAFSNVPNLQTLRLDSNRFSSMRPEPLSALARLKSLVLHNNPWRCDCRLAALHAWTRDRNLYTPPTACAEPEPLRGRLWSDLAPEQLACAPRIVYPGAGARIEAPASSDITLRCRAEGEPPPVIHWVHNTRILANDSRRPSSGDEHSFTLRASGSWLNLTIHNVRHSDRGEYTCVSKSSGGLDERAVALTVVAGYGAGALAGISTTLAWILLLSFGAMLVICIIIALFCWLCRNESAQTDRGNKKYSRDGSSTTGGKTVVKESVSNEQEKSLIKKVNPVQKPPRSAESPVPVAVSSSSDVSDMKTALLDTPSTKQPPSVAGSECTQGSTVSSSGCSNSDSTVLQNSANEGVIQTSSRKIYPPDLLSFPSRTSQVMPNANIPFRTFKNTQLSPQENGLCSSPVHSPQQQLFESSLPHSLSQSSLSTMLFKANVAAAQRAGFVTLPRHPHQLGHRNSITEGSLASHLLSNKPTEIHTTGSPLSGNAILSLNRNIRSGTMPTIVQCLPLSPTTKRLFLPPHHTSNSPLEEQPTLSLNLPPERKPTLVRRHSTKSNMSSPLLSPDLVQINSFHEGSNQTSPLRINENLVRLAPDGASIRGHDEMLSRTPSILDSVSSSFSRDVGGRNSIRKYKLPATQHFASPNVVTTDPLSRTIYRYDNEDGTAV